MAASVAVIRLSRPSPKAIRDALAVHDRSLRYPEVGATRDPSVLATVGSRYDVDRHRFPLGRGPDLFERARTGLLAWRHFDIPWLALHGAETRAAVDRVVATLTRVCGVWFVNPCRVVYVEESAFAYGTLDGHVECGEERFEVRVDPATDEVVYEVVAFSRPAIPIARIAKPWVRRLQRRFVRDSAAALARACR